MKSDEAASIDCESWARRANARWIVHGGLSRTAEAYLDHLRRTDPERLARSCRNAYRVTGKCEAAMDPKPWFYGGLFSLATPEEARKFLACHSFTAALIPSAQGNSDLNERVKAVSQGTRERIHRIREAIAEVVRRN